MNSDLFLVFGLIISGLANPEWLVEIAVIAEAPAFVIEPEG